MQLWCIRGFLPKRFFTPHDKKDRCETAITLNSKKIEHIYASTLYHPTCHIACVNPENILQGGTDNVFLFSFF